MARSKFHRHIPWSSPTLAEPIQLFWSFQVNVLLVSTAKRPGVKDIPHFIIDHIFDRGADLPSSEPGSGGFRKNRKMENRVGGYAEFIGFYGAGSAYFAGGGDWFPDCPGIFVGIRLDIGWVDLKYSSGASVE